MWKVGRKRGWWRGVKGGDVALFVVGLAVVEGVFEVRPRAVGGVGKGVAWLRGVDNWRGEKGEKEGEGKGD